MIREEHFNEILTGTYCPNIYEIIRIDEGFLNPNAFASFILIPKSIEFDKFLDIKKIRDSVNSILENKDSINDCESRLKALRITKNAIELTGYSFLKRQSTEYQKVKNMIVQLNQTIDRLQYNFYPFVIRRIEVFKGNRICFISDDRKVASYDTLQYLKELYEMDDDVFEYYRDYLYEMHKIDVRKENE